MSDFFNCQQCIDLLMDYLEGTLDSETHKKLDEHLSACAPCVNFVRTSEKCEEMTKRLRDQQVTVPLEVQNRIKSFLTEEIVTLRKS